MLALGLILILSVYAFLLLVFIKQAETFMGKLYIFCGVSLFFSLCAFVAGLVEQYEDIIWTWGIISSVLFAPFLWLIIKKCVIVKIQIAVQNKKKQIQSRKAGNAIKKNNAKIDRQIKECEQIKANTINKEDLAQMKNLKDLIMLCGGNDDTVSNFIAAQELNWKFIDEVETNKSALAEQFRLVGDIDRFNKYNN